MKVKQAQWVTYAFFHWTLWDSVKDLLSTIVLWFKSSSVFFPAGLDLIICFQGHLSFIRPGGSNPQWLGPYTALMDFRNPLCRLLLQDFGFHRRSLFTIFP